MKKLIALMLGILMLASIPCAAFAVAKKQDVEPVEVPVEEETDEIPEYTGRIWSPILKFSV